MRLMMLRMSSSNSLTAFSTSLAQGGINASAIGPGAAISRVRAVGPQVPPPGAPASKLLSPDPSTGAPPSSALPRGSLLDLSV